MNKIFLKFDSEESAISIMSDYYNSKTSSWIMHSENHDLDILGPLVGLSGFHINMLFGRNIRSIPSKLVPYLVNPSNPIRVFG